jgi:hypothetical protein
LVKCRETVGRNLKNLQHVLVTIVCIIIHGVIPYKVKVCF